MTTTTNTTLTDRYVAAVSRGLPEPQRRDVELELLTAIADAIEDRVAGGEPFASAERAVLTGMGDPARLSATYADRPLHLIGPAHFLDFQRLLVVLLATVVPIVAVVVAVVAAFAGDDIGRVIVAGGSAGIATGIQIAFWVTLAFAIVERVGPGAGIRTPLMPWSLDNLPDPAPNRLGPSQVVPSLVALALSIGFVVWQQVFPFIPGPDDTRVPGINPDLWSFWLPYLLVLLFAEMLLEVAKLRVGRWTMGLATANAALNVAFAAPFAWLAWRADLVNPEVFRALDWTTATESGGVVATASAIGIIVVGAWGAVEGFVNARRRNRPGPARKLVPAL